MQGCLISAFLSYSLGVIAATFLELGVVLPLYLALALLSLFLKSRRMFLLLILCMALGSVRYELTLPTPLPEGWTRLEGVVQEVKEDEEDRWASYDLKTDLGLIRVFGKAGARPGDKVAVEGMMEIPRGATNPGQFDYRAYLLRQGIANVLDARGAPEILERGVPWSPIALRELIRDRVRRALSTGGALERPDIVLGVVMGDRGLLDEHTEDVFARAGVNHILAVSGLHVGYVVLAVSLLTGGERRALPVLIAVLAVYAFVTGLRPSVVRASLMTVLAIAGRAAGRQTDGLSFLAASGLLLLLLRPALLFEASFQYSFAATAGILLLYDPVTRWVGRGRLGGALAVTLAAGLAVLPLNAYYYHMLSLVSPVANLVIVPLMGVVVLVGLATAVVGSVVYLSPLLKVANAFTGILCRLSEFLAEVFTSLPLSSLIVGTPNPLTILAYYTLLVPLLWPGLLRTRLVLLLAASLVVWGVVLYPPPDPGVIFLDVGQGDAAVIETPGGKYVLIDGGTERAGESVVLPYLLHRGVRVLDLVIVTHTHDDHAAGVIEVLKKIPAREIWVGGTADLPGHTVIRPRPGHVLQLELRVVLTVLGPVGSLPASENDRSLVVRLDMGGMSVLFTGDIEGEGEKALLTHAAALDADVLKAPHHGSANSARVDFLRAVEPAVVVISVGEDNKHGLPADLFLRRIEGIPLYRTDRHGAIRVRPSRDGLVVRTMLGGIVEKLEAR